MLILSKKFITALKLNDLPAYKIAHLADLHPATLSKLLHGIEPIRPNDERVKRVAIILGLSMEEALDGSDVQ